jgi:hypothetical protein
MFIGTSYLYNFWYILQAAHQKKLMELKELSIQLPEHTTELVRQKCQQRIDSLRLNVTVATVFRKCDVNTACSEEVYSSFVKWGNLKKFSRNLLRRGDSIIYRYVPEVDSVILYRYNGTIRSICL